MPIAVKDVVVTGTTANANVDVTTVHGTGAMPLTWENVDGTWKLSGDAVTQLSSMGSSHGG